MKIKIALIKRKIGELDFSILSSNQKPFENRNEKCEIRMDLSRLFRYYKTTEIERIDIRYRVLPAQISNGTYFLHILCIDILTNIFTKRAPIHNAC